MISTDPLGYVDGPNLYQYGLNNPINFSDPMGLLVGVPEVPALRTEAALRDLAIATNPEVPPLIRLQALNSAVGSAQMVVGEQGLLAVVNFPARADRATDAAATDFTTASLLAKDPLEKTKLFSRGTGRIFLSFADGLAVALPAANASASPVLRVLGNMGRRLNPFGWFDDVGEAAARGFQEGVQEAVPAMAPDLPAVPRGPFSWLVPGGGLAAHEAAGGHLLARHVGQTGPQLTARLAAEPNIPTASTFLTRAEAEAGVSAVLDANAIQLSTWEASGAQGQIVLRGPFSGGLVLQRGAATATSGSEALVVLRGTGGGAWRIHTGYPVP